jgi:hypothetical protein
MATGKTAPPDKLVNFRADCVGAGHDFVEGARGGGGRGTGRASGVGARGSWRGAARLANKRRKLVKMYGPPPECKKNRQWTRSSLRKCIRP